MRCFLALPLPDDLAAQLAGFAARLRVGRPVPEENIHLTLAFLEEQPVEALEDLNTELEVLRAPSIPVDLAGLTTMGGAVPSVLAIRAEGVDALHKQIAQAVRRAGITLPYRRFRGHVTLARLPRTPTADDLSALGRALEAHGAIRYPTVTLDTLSLYRSDLRPDGARYERLADYPLRG
ncbi:RNA 2',3'-cyclic phosphodiesterase [Aliiroseovarius zhejiangensis]|uniref:RNA 2',3'-cyclic phosphodiesterase n=1 Tax=Aliiroseovarius zhejiangensis TaxID=1632025 RepID=A0ABQ3IVX4_9RHOB|nr:RNA 2',3'-cyclic phosphodiesterase [Aliiroseovarius zhejiangensis]GHE92773.1 RNA 2',3'-cyclic phosphodiesterase [Aliiroseovarius zhejiangensis]